MHEYRSQAQREAKDLYKMWLQLVHTLASTQQLEVLHVGEMQPLLQPVIMSVLQGMQGEHSARALQGGSAAGAVGAVGIPSWQGQDVAAKADARSREDGAREELLLGVATSRLCVVILAGMASLWTEAEGPAESQEGADRRKLY